MQAGIYFGDEGAELGLRDPGREELWINTGELRGKVPSDEVVAWNADDSGGCGEGRGKRYVGVLVREAGVRGAPCR